MGTSASIVRTSSWRREPLFHFLVGGALIFGGHASLSRSRSHEEERRSTIDVNAGTLERLRAEWQRLWKRPPSEQELRGLVQDHIREEVLYREGIALGLDRDDTIIRRRLVQKLEFLTKDLAAQGPLDDETLAKYYEDNAARYMEPARVSFSQIYFSRERRGADAEAAAKAALADLSRRPDAAEELGDPTLLPLELHGASATEVDAQFGPDFAALVNEAPLDEWQGPVPSSYGFHLIRVTDRSAGKEPGLAAVRDAVLRDFQEERRQETNRELLERLKEQYLIKVDEESIRKAAVNEMAGGASG